MRVYLDLVMGLNFLVDLLLLLGTNRLSGFPAGWKRTVPAAALGAMYSGGCCLPGFYFLGNTFWRLVCLGLIRLRLPGLTLPVLLLIARGRGRLLISARLLRILSRRIGLRGILPGLLAPLGRISIWRLAVVHP